MPKSFFPGDPAFAVSGFRILSEEETGPDYDHGAVGIHADGTECRCQWECVEVCDEYWLSANAWQLPESGATRPLPQ